MSLNAMQRPLHQGRLWLSSGADCVCQKEPTSRVHRVFCSAVDAAWLAAFGLFFCYVVLSVPLLKYIWSTALTRALSTDLQH